MIKNTPKKVATTLSAIVFYPIDLLTTLSNIKYSIWPVLITQMLESTFEREKRPSIETVWALLERKVYENNWEAKDLDALARRIKRKVKELERKHVASYD